MEIQYVTALRGPNIWARFPVLEVWVDLQEWKDRASSEIPGFNDRLKALLPSLVEHRCSVGERGGFFQRLERGTYLAHILEHVVLELQTLAGSEVGFGKTRHTSTNGVYKMGLRYHVEELARAAVYVGRDLCLAAAQNTPFDVAENVARLTEILRTHQPNPFTQAVMAAARERGVPARLLDAGGLLQLGYGSHQRRLLDGLTDRSSAVGNSIAYDRELTRSILQSMGVPLPWGRSVNDAADAWVAAQEMTLPVVLRPAKTGMGRVLGPFETQAQVEAGFAQARHEGWWPLVDHHAGGDEHRFLVIGRQVIVGMKLAREVIPQHAIHPQIQARLVDALVGLKLEVGEVEAVLTDVTKPLEDQQGVIVGVVAQPELAKYDVTAVGSALVDLFYPEPRKSRIPIASVTGTNGKTTTTRLTAHIFGQAFGPVGMCCTEGIYLGTRRIAKGDCSGPKSARIILQHHEPRAAVLETARGGILREGLGFDRCDAAIITNIGEGDHLGSSDIETPADLAWVKSTLVWSVADWGHAVLNANDPLVVDMATYCHGKVIYFALDPSHPVITAHRQKAGKAVIVRNGSIVLAEGETERELIGLDRVPLTHGGRIPFQVENALAASGAAWGVGIADALIAQGLETFDPGMDRLPARFNILDLNGLTVVLDYGHNTSALVRLFEVLAQFPHSKRSVVYSAAGDRRNQDIIDQGEQLGGFFDQVFLYEDTYLRGRNVGDISRLFREGMAKASRVRQIVEVIGGMEAIEKAIVACKPGELLVVQPDRIDDGVALLKRFLAQGGREITLTEAFHPPSSANPKEFPMREEKPYRPKQAPATEHESVTGAKVEIRETPLGNGVFARRAFQPGEMILDGWGPVTPERSKYTIQIDHDLHVVPPIPLRYLNHSCEPNCGLLNRLGGERLEVHALRPIDANEELTLDYETFELEFEALTGPCLCGKSACRGSLGGYKEMSESLRENYGEYIAEYLREADVPLTVMAGRA